MRTYWTLAALGLALCSCGTLRSAPASALRGYSAEVVNAELAGGLVVPGSGVLLIWGSDGSILRSDDGARWQHAETPGYADLNRIASNEDGSVLVAVGTKGVILRSGDGGRHWNPVAGDFADCDLKAVVNHAPSGAWLAVGTRGRILRSTDAGRSWSVIDSQQTLDFQALFVDPRTQAVLIGGDDGAVGISADGGKSWHLTFIAMPQPATPVTTFFRYGGLLLANSALGRFLTSADDGASWDLLQSDSKAFFTDSAFDPRHGAIVLTGHNGDVLRSTDGGHNWQKVELQLDGRRSYLSSVMFDPQSASLIAVGAGGTIARSVDGGASWSRASADVNGGIHGLLGEPTRHRLIVFGAGGLVADSTDSGIHWTAAQVALDMYLREVTRVPRSDILVATSSLGDFIRSTDGGAHWQQQAVDYPDPRTPPDLRVLVASPDGHSLLAAGPPGSILSSNDRGSTWSVQHWTKIEDERAFPWLLEDRRRNLLVAVEARGRMQVSRDGGGAWQASEVPTRGVEWPYWQGAVLERTGVMLVAGKSGSGARSTDGTSWTVIDTGTSKDLFGSFADETSGALYLMGQDGTLLRSTDSALTWRALESGSRSELRRMLRDPKSGALLCFGGHGAIVRSTDDGVSWQAVVSGTDGVLRKGLIEPRTGDLLLAGSQGALLRSGDGGRSWRQVFTHTARHFNSMTVDDNGVIVLVGERIVRLVPH